MTTIRSTTTTQEVTPDTASLDTRTRLPTRLGCRRHSTARPARRTTTTGCTSLRATTRRRPILTTTDTTPRTSLTTPWRASRTITTPTMETTPRSVTTTTSATTPRLRRTRCWPANP